MLFFACRTDHWFQRFVRSWLCRIGFLFIVLFPALAPAKDFEGYRETTLDDVMDQWNDATKNEEIGVSISMPQKIRFIATMREAPRSCGNAMLAHVLNVVDLGYVLKQVSITHCLTIVSASGRVVVAYVQDVLVAGLQADAKVGGSLDLYADMCAFVVNADRSRNTPIMFISRFEPR